MSHLRFSVIIVTFNGLHYLNRFLPSVLKTRYPNFEIIVADNGSKDGTSEWIRRTHKEVSIVPLKKNYGYCGGNNQAAKAATGDILLFLNNDVEVEPNWLTPLSEAFLEDPLLGALQPKLLAYRDKESFEYAGAAGGFLDRYGYPFCRGRIFETLEKDLGQYDSAVEVLWASGAALGVRRELFLEVGGFDEDFEFHMDEIDLCWRLRNLGYRVKCLPESTVYHLGGGSLANGSPKKLYYNYRNNLVMLWKNLSEDTLFRRFFTRCALDLLAALRALVRARFREFHAIGKAYISFLFRIVSTQRKRKELLLKRTEAKNPSTLLECFLVKEYFLRRRRTFRELAPGKKPGAQKLKVASSPPREDQIKVAALWSSPGSPPPT
jgi:hypothetical protein